MNSTALAFFCVLVALVILGLALTTPIPSPWHILVGMIGGASIAVGGYMFHRQRIR